MKPIDSNLLCPSCQQALAPTVLCCAGCNVRLEGPFQLNEFATLPPEDLHFLRIFVRCEGRIKDMEPALGLSYPTIRARLGKLKNQLAGVEAVEVAHAKTPLNAQEVLENLDRGQIDFDEAMEQLKKIRKP